VFEEDGASYLTLASNRVLTESRPDVTGVLLVTSQQYELGAAATLNIF